MIRRYVKKADTSQPASSRASNPRRHWYGLSRPISGATRPTPCTGWMTSYRAGFRR